MGPVDFAGISGEAGMQMRALPEEAVSYQIRDTPAGYRPLPGYPKWQVVPDAACPWDPQVVRAMRALDPAIVPLWATWVYAPPADQSDKTVFITGRHAVGWHRPDLPSQEFHALMPSGRIGGMSFKRPTRIWKIYHEAHETNDRIGGFVPWSWWMYYNLRDEFCENGFRSMREINEMKRQAIQKQKQEHDQLMADMDEATAPFIEKALEGVRPMDWKLWLEGGYKTVQPKKLQVGYRRVGPTPASLGRI